MKKLLVYIIAIFPFFASAQSPVEIVGNFTVQGKVGSLNAPARAYLFYQLGANKIVDSALITNGSFIFRGDVLDPNQALLLIDHTGQGYANLDPKNADIINFYIEKGTISVTSATDSVAKAQITGSPVTDAFKNLMALITPVYDKARALKAQEDAVPEAEKNTDTYIDEENAKHNALAAEQTAIFEKFIKDNPNNYLSLMVLSSLGPSPDYIILNDLYNSLGQNIKDSEAAKVLRRSIDKLKPTALGEIAPDFTQNDINGTPVSLSSFRGKYVLIDFWASWCGPCRQENPYVVKVYNKFKNRNFTIIGISLDKPDGKNDWLAAIKHDGLNWTQLSDLNYWSNQVALLYGVQSIPHNFLLDPSGKIIAKDLRGNELDNKLTEIFGKM